MEFNSIPYAGIVLRRRQRYESATEFHLKCCTGKRKSDLIKTDGGIDMTKTRWHLKGEWFDVCSCKLPCPCTFAQEPTHGDCLFTLVWQVHEGYYNDIRLDGFGVVALGEFAGMGR